MPPALSEVTSCVKIQGGLVAKREAAAGLAWRLPKRRLKVPCTECWCFFIVAELPLPAALPAGHPRRGGPGPLPGRLRGGGGPGRSHLPPLLPPRCLPPPGAARPLPPCPAEAAPAGFMGRAGPGGSLEGPARGASAAAGGPRAAGGRPLPAGGERGEDQTG